MPFEPTRPVATVDSKLLAVPLGGRLNPMKRQFRAPRAISDLPLVALCVVLVSLSTIPLYARPTDQANASSQEFQRRLEAYLDLRRMLLQQLKPILPTTSAMELAARQTQLAQALRTARMQAKPGDLLSADAAALIRASIVEDFRARTAADERAAFSEVPPAARPAINGAYPAEAALPTVPPLLLMSLPRLPEQLQYRFYGRHLVLLDSDARIIVDYLPNALPR
jgi:hypothetical protein